MKISLDPTDTRESLNSRRYKAELLFTSVAAKYHDVWIERRLTYQDEIKNLESIKSFRGSCMQLKSSSDEPTSDIYLHHLYDELSHRMGEFSAVLTRLSNNTKIETFCAPLKQEARVISKAHFDYNGDYSCVVDIGRGCAIGDTLKDVAIALNWILSNCDCVRVKNRFFDAREAILSRGGYRDILVNIRVAGYIFEIQIHWRPLYALKEEAHEQLEIARLIMEPTKKKLALLDVLESEKKLRDDKIRLEEVISGLRTEIELYKRQENRGFSALVAAADNERRAREDLLQLQEEVSSQKAKNATRYAKFFRCFTIIAIFVLFLAFIIPIIMERFAKQAVVLTLKSTVGRDAEAMIWNKRELPLQTDYFELDSSSKKITILRAGIYRFDVKIFGHKPYPIFVVNGKPIMYFYGAIPGENGDATLNFVYEAGDNSVVEVKFQSDCGTLDKDHHFLSVQKLEAAFQGSSLVVATFGGIPAQAEKKMLWNQAFVPKSGLDSRFFRVTDRGDQVMLLVSGIYRFDIKILGRRETYAYLTIDDKSIEETHFCSDSNNVDNDATLNIVLAIAQVPARLSVLFQRASEVFPHSHHHFSIERLGSARSGSDRAVVVTLGSSQGKRGRYMVWDVIHLIDSEYFTRLTDMTSVQIHQKGNYRFDVKVSGAEASNVHAFLAINEESKVEIFGPSSTGFNEATLSVIFAVEANVIVAVKFTRDDDKIYAGRRHSLCIQKLD